MRLKWEFVCLIFSILGSNLCNLNVISVCVCFAVFGNMKYFNKHIYYIFNFLLQCALCKKLFILHIKTRIQSETAGASDRRTNNQTKDAKRFLVFLFPAISISRAKYRMPFVHLRVVTVNNLWTRFHIEFFSCYLYLCNFFRASPRTIGALRTSFGHELTPPPPVLYNHGTLQRVFFLLL